MAFEISEAFIRQHCTDEVFRRGDEYERAGAVVSTVRRADLLVARVEGSEPEPYRVQLRCDEAGLMEASCSCRHASRGWCTHIGAALLANLRHPEAVVEHPSIETLLARLDRGQLQAILLNLAERDAVLADVIEGQVAGLQNRAGESVAAVGSPPRQSSVDTKEIRRQVRSILHSVNGMRASEAYGYVGGIASDVGHVVEKAWDFIRAGEGNAAMTVLEAITEEYVDDWTELDDSDGYLGEFFNELGQAWTEAILTADLTPDEREAWEAKLDGWAAEMDEYGIDDAFWSATAALVQGWDEPVIQRILRGETSAPIDDNGVEVELNPDLTMARLNVLQRQGRGDEFLHLAQAAGQYERYAAKLLEMGRVSDALEIALTSIGSATEAFSLAQTLRERGELEQALQLAEHGITLAGPKAKLATWLCDLADGLGQPERALAAAVVVFREEPDLPSFKRVQELAKERWPEYRAELLAHLQAKRPFYPRGPVDVFLHEGMIDDAIASVDQSFADDVTEQVIRAAISIRPEWVIQKCRRYAESIMNGGRAQHYDEAARWLGHARDSYRALGQSLEWRSYLQGLLVQHTRKYKLRPMLEALGA